MDNERTPAYEFDGFRLDVSRKSLWFGGDIVSLTPKSLETLIVLVRNRHRVVEKVQIFDEVWPDVFVEEATLAQNIRTLRKTLAKYRSDSEFIATVPRRGYRFVAEVSEIYGDDEAIPPTDNHAEGRSVATGEPIRESTGHTAVARKIGLHRWFAAIAIAVIAVFLGDRMLIPNTSLLDTRFVGFRVDQLASNASSGNVALSPNGKYVVATRTSDGAESLVLYQTNDSNPLTLVEKLSGRFLGAAFSTDGDRIFYAIQEQPEADIMPIGALYQIPLLGGAARRIATDVDSAPAVSPKGEQIAFIRRDPNMNATMLIVAGINGYNQKILAVRQLTEGFTQTGLSWSPDGNRIATTVAASRDSGRQFMVNVVGVENGEQRVIGDAAWAWAGQTAWLADGSGIGVVAFGAEAPHASDEIWLVSYPEGKSRFVSNGVNGIFGISLSSDSSTLAAVKSSKISGFYVAPIDSPENSQRILTKLGDDGLFPPGADWTNDDRVIYSQTINGNADLWSVDANGGAPKQITSDASRELLPRIARDGQFMIFLSNRSGRMNVWRSNVDGTAPKQLTSVEDVTDAVLSPDGANVFYLSNSAESAFPVLWKIGADGGESQRMTDRQTFSPRISPDGRVVAAYYSNPGTNRMSLALLSADDGSVVKYIDQPRSDSIPMMEWSPDGKAVYIVISQKGRFALWRQPIDGEAVKLHEWKTDAVFRFAVSKDGRRIFFDQGIETNSIILLRDSTLSE